MSIQLLEFKVKDNLFSIKTEYVKQIFEIEKVKPVSYLENYVCGFTVYSEKSYLLIDFASIAGLGNSCKENLIGKTAVVVDVFGKTYALIVDEIVKIREIEKKSYEGDIISFYKDKDIVIEEITPEFLSLRIKVPPLKQLLTKKGEESLAEKKKVEKKEQNFLIFALENLYYGINTQFVKKVEYLDYLNETPVDEDGWIEGVLLIKDTPVKVGNLKKILKLNEKRKRESLILIEDQRKKFGIFADEIVDIYPVEEEQIHKGSDEEILQDFFVYKNKVVPILSGKFLKEVLDRYSLETISKKEEERTTKFSDKTTFLLIQIASKIFAVPMENLGEVLEYKDIHLSNYPSDNPLIKGIAAYRNFSFFLITLEPILNVELKDDKKVLLLQKDEKLVGVLITDIYDLIDVPKTDVFLLDTDDSLVGGTVYYNGDLIEILNIHWLLK